MAWILEVVLPKKRVIGIARSYSNTMTRRGTVMVPRSQTKSALKRVRDGATVFFTPANPESTGVMSTPARHSFSGVLNKLGQRDV